MDWLSEVGGVVRDYSNTFGLSNYKGRGAII